MQRTGRSANRTQRSSSECDSPGLKSTELQQGQTCLNHSTRGSQLGQIISDGFTGNLRSQKRMLKYSNGIQCVRPVEGDQFLASATRSGWNNSRKLKSEQTWTSSSFLRSISLGLLPIVTWHWRQMEEIEPSERNECRKMRGGVSATRASIHPLERPRVFTQYTLAGASRFPARVAR